MSEVWNRENCWIKIAEAYNEANPKAACDKAILILESIANNIAYFDTHTNEIPDTLDIVFGAKHIINTAISNKTLKANEPAEFIAKLIVLSDELKPLEENSSQSNESDVDRTPELLDFADIESVDPVDSSIQ